MAMSMMLIGSVFVTMIPFDMLVFMPMKNCSVEIAGVKMLVVAVFVAMGMRVDRRKVRMQVGMPLTS